MLPRKKLVKQLKPLFLGVEMCLKSLDFPVSMHWANNTFEYIRPVHTLTVLLDEEEV